MITYFTRWLEEHDFYKKKCILRYSYDNPFRGTDWNCLEDAFISHWKEPLEFTCKGEAKERGNYIIKGL